MNFTVVVYASDEVSYSSLRMKLEKNGVSSILWCDAKIQSRTEFINQNLNQWLIFLDHDCELNSENLKIIKKVTFENPSSSLVFAGLYTDGVSSSYIQKVHNFIANTWLLQSYERHLQKLG